MRFTISLFLLLWFVQSGFGATASTKRSADTPALNTPAPKSAAAQASDSPLGVIQSVGVSDSKDHQVVELKLSKDYEQQITYIYDPGVFSAILPKTKFDPKLKNIRVNNQFITNIRLRSENNRTIMEIRFADHGFDSVGKVTHLANFDHLSFMVFPKKPDPAAINGATSKTKAGATAPRSLDGLPPQTNTLDGPLPLQVGDLAPGLSNYAIMQMLAALALVLALIYGLLWAYNRYFVKKLNFKKGPYQIRLASTFHMGPKQKVVVLEINEMAFACSVSQQQISVIAQVDRGDFEQFMGARSLIAKDSVDFAALRDEYRKSRLHVTPESKPVEVPVSFAAELLDKVKRLKPID